MGENSAIEWTDHTFNPWIGCTKVSPGCDHCYAEALMDKRWHRVKWGPHGERKRTGLSTWQSPVFWNAKAKERGVRARVFCASLADWLDNQVPVPWREDLAELIEATPHLDWLLLTKRPENWSKLSPWHDDDVPPNVWLGITAEDDEHYARRWAIYREIEATVHFVSYEPALGPLNLRRSDNPDWIICGGESGPGRRQFDPAWARTLRDQCKSEGVAFFMKQIDKVQPIPADLMIRQFPQSRVLREQKQKE